MDRRGPSRERALLGLLDAVTTTRLTEWLAGATTTSDPAYDARLGVLATALTLHWQGAADLARDLGVPDDADVEAGWLHRAALAWATSGDPGPGVERGARRLRRRRPAGRERHTGSLLGVRRRGGRVGARTSDLAAELVERLGPGLWMPFGHGFDAMVVACRARLLAFRGDVGAARAVLEASGPSYDASSATTTVLAATQCLVLGNDAEPAEVRRLAAVVEENAAQPRDLVGAGAQMLAAFGLIAVGEVSEAVRRLLVAGGDADLSALNVIDRALGLELLVALAVAEGSLDDAEVWRDRALPLLGSPIADSTVARLMSRVELLAGRPDAAVVWAERAVARAIETDRGIEAAEGEIVLSRARLAARGPGDRKRAVDALERMVAEAELRGHRAARTSAARELRPLGQRLRPLSGSGWSGLTAREAEVARSVADGLSNGAIARRLHVSEHTVRAHVSRVLAAFGVANRSALPAALGIGGESGDHADLAPLTTRQRQVAGLVAEGLGNAAIADRLGLSQRTVEKHVSDILLRWGLPGRTAVARRLA